MNSLYGLYEELRARAGNLCFSPFSIQTALGMAYAGARGETADQMRRVLASDLSDEQLHANAAKVMGQLNARSDGSQPDDGRESIWKVTEEGTEAAAATALTMPCGSSMPPPKPPPVPVFQADHPFVFAIRERRSRAILFLGRLVDPTRA